MADEQPVEYVYLLAGVIVVTPFLIHNAILKSLPEHLQTTPLNEGEIPGALRSSLARYQAAGFERLGPALRVHLPQPPVLVPLVHRGKNAYATVFEFPGATPRRGYDVVSILEPGWMTLTTGMDIGGGALPAPPSTFNQIFSGADVDELLRRHEQALGFLCQGGRARPRLPRDFEEALALSFRRLRKHFESARVRNTLTALWRVVTKSTPHVGPISEQAVAQRQLRKLREQPVAPRSRELVSR